MKFGPDGDIPGGKEFFERPPLETPYFRGCAALAVLTFVGGAVVLDRTMRGHTFLAAPLTICVSLGAVLLFWNAALRVHRRISDLYKTGAIKDVQPGDPLEVAIRAAAGMTNLGLLYVSALTGMLIVELGQVLKHW